jgi:hypothetical protein
MGRQQFSRRVIPRALVSQDIRELLSKSLETTLRPLPGERSSARHGENGVSDF